MALAEHQWTEGDFREINTRIDRWRVDPVAFVRESIGMNPNPHQQQMLKSIQEFVSGGGKFGTSIRSGQGCGKSCGAAMAILWFLVCFRNSLIHCTAPTEKQLNTVLWGELEKMIRNSPFLRQFLEWRATRICVRGESVNWSAIACTARNVEAIQGKHRTDMLVVVDEASGVEDKFLDALLGGMSEPHNLALMISNPTIPYGIFYESHTKDQHLWDSMRFSARESMLVTDAHIDRMERKYGPESPIVRVRVDGEFPEQSEMSLMNRVQVQECCNQDEFEVEDSLWHMGIDVARYGADQSAAVVRSGRNVKFIDRWHGASLGESCGRIIGMLGELPLVRCVKVDEIGVGAGLYDMLVEQQGAGKIDQDVLLVPINVAHRAYDDERYPRLRDQLWFELADVVNAGQIAFSDDCERELVDGFASEVVPMEYKFTIDGRRVVDKKDDMRAKLGYSPDIGDAMCLAFHEESAGLVGFVDLGVVA